jgi:hypothetical protein
MERNWLTLSVISLGLGGLLALVAAVARTPLVYKLVPPDYFYHSIIGHVDLAIVGFFLTFGMLLWQKNYRVELKPSFYLSLLGIGGIALVALSGTGKAVPNNYLPTIDHPLFWVSALLFFSGFWLASFRLLPEALEDIGSEDPKKHLLSLSIVLSVLMFLAFIFSLPKVGSKEELYLFYERLYWAPGHIHQFINGVFLLYAWYYLLELRGVKPSLGRLKHASALLFGFSFSYVLIPLALSDTVSEQARRLTDLGYAFGIGLFIFLHLFKLLKHIRVELKNLYSSALMLSIALYLLGVFIAYAGLMPALLEYFMNPHSHYVGMKSSLSIPAHYHGVITSQTLAFMVLTYSLLKELELGAKLSKVSLLQAYMYGVGMFMFVLGLFFAGLKGAPRKTYGTAFTNDPFVLLSLSLMGAGTLLAVLAGIIFVVYALKSLLSPARGE